MKHVTMIPVPASTQQTGSPIWRFSKDQESEIVNLAAQCQSKQQQREPLDVVLPYDETEYDSDDDYDLSTSFPDQLTTDGTKQVKMEFLDRLAEIVCREKDASYVTCASIIEDEEQVMIVIARNAKWTETDMVFLNKLADLMEMISSSESSQEADVPVLCELLANYYLARLKHHATQVKKLVKDVNSQIKAVIVRCCEEFLSGKKTPLKFVKSMKDYASDHEWVNDKLSPKQLQKIKLEVAFICRPDTAANTFFDIARDIPSFQKVYIQLLIGCKPRKVRQKLIIAGKSSTTKNEKFLPSERWIHAEMRMITYLFNRENTDQPFSYLGISKKTCFLCGHVLKKLNMFHTRANHGKIYSLWTLPPVLVMRDAYIQRWERVVNHLLDVLRAEVSRQDLPHMDAMKESTMTTPIVKVANVEDPFAGSSADIPRREREFEWYSRFSRRPRVSEAEDTEYIFPRPSDAEIHEISREPTLESHDEPRALRTVCANCGKYPRGTIFCSKCPTVSYCDSDCRNLHWRNHKFHCSLGRSIDEANDLVKACQLGDELSLEGNVLKAFGFFHFGSRHERSRLFQIYRKLILHGVGEEELREAWQKKKLKEFIVSRCAQLPPCILATERVWIRQAEGFARDSERGLGSIPKSLNLLLNAEDRRLSPSELKPKAKRTAYLFYIQIFNQFMPAADEGNWISLGFCTARNQEETQFLAHLYALLIKQCKFEEFWKAIDESTLIDLFKKYKLADSISRVRNFETLMRDIGKWHQSVWELKKFTQTSENLPTRSVEVDYGFENCQGALERLGLRQIYIEYFARGEDEMILHQACIDGRLAKFLKDKLGPLQIPDEVFANDYPGKGCTYNGMTVKSTIICTESMYPMVLERQKAEGGRELIITVPDEEDEIMKDYVRGQAAFTTGRMRVETQTTSHGVKMTSMSVDC